MEWIKRKIKNKILKRILVAVIVMILGALGFSEELAREFANAGADIAIEQIDVAE